MNKLIITKWNGRLLTALISDKEILELSLEEESSILGNIYIGKVNKIVKNLNSAFVDLGGGRSGYYSLVDNPVSIFAGQEKKRLTAGDEIVVQVAKDAVKTKDPVLTANLSFAGKYAVVTAGKKVVGFSAKITDRQWKEDVRPRLEALTKGNAGVIVRTNAYGMEKELMREAAYLIGQYQKLLQDAKYRTCYSLLHQEEAFYIKSLKGCPSGTLAEVVTDEKTVFDTLERWMRIHQPEDLPRLRLYQDKMVTLGRVYSLDTAMRRACDKRVWLKSGGYLVIEPTEAMVVIDVNTGKYSGKKNLDDTIRMINLEAAREICHQLRLRNLSGIIMIDFIDMKEESDQELLLEELRLCAACDPVKISVVDMTKLGLVELTRKKGKRPLWEQVNRGNHFPEQNVRQEGDA